MWLFLNDLKDIQMLPVRRRGAGGAKNAAPIVFSLHPQFLLSLQIPRPKIGLNVLQQTQPIFWNYVWCLLNLLKCACHCKVRVFHVETFQSGLDFLGEDNLVIGQFFFISFVIWNTILRRLSWNWLDKNSNTSISDRSCNNNSVIGKGRLPTACHFIDGV